MTKLSDQHFTTSAPTFGEDDFLDPFYDTPMADRAAPANSRAESPVVASPFHRAPLPTNQGARK